MGNVDIYDQPRSRKEKHNPLLGQDSEMAGLSHLKKRKESDNMGPTLNLKQTSIP